VTTAKPPDWGGEPGAFWAANDLRYDTMLAPLTTHLLDAAALTPADRVLDIGCGCGNTSRLAARQAADVLGADLSHAMLARARQRTEEAGLTNVRFVHADAQTTPFEPVDVVMSQLGVMFFEDPAAAFANLRRAGGRLAFLCWQRPELNEKRMLLREAFGHSHREIADIVAVSEANSRELHARARRHLSRPAHGSACRPGPSVLVVDHNIYYRQTIAAS